MSKQIDLKKTVFELTKEYPEIINIMADLGFSEITKKAMLNSVGRMITIPKGAEMRNVPMEKIIKAFKDNGFEVTNGKDLSDNNIKEKILSFNKLDQRTEQLKSYLKRLGEGDSLDNVRADFVKNFSEVDASEIMKAEQQLLAEGTPLEEVQKLCDVHSALFHGSTKIEHILNDKEVKEVLNNAHGVKMNLKEDNDLCSNLTKKPGHPLQTFTLENEALTNILKEANKAIEENKFSKELLEKVRDVSVHYAKKGDLLYPHLKVQYNISGPSNVMWTVDDEIRDELSKLAKDNNHNEEWIKRLKAVLKRVDEMIYKETFILFPNCADNFTEEEWKKIYRDSKDYKLCFGIEEVKWPEAENYTEEIKDYNTEEVVLPGGHLTIEQLTCMLNTIPIEITFVDDNNINRFFNEGPKVFKRPGMAIDREVFTCHPPKVETMVRAIIEDFRAGKRDSVPVWMDKGGRTMLVNYMAVRDRDGKYIGTVELVQDMEFAKEYFLK